MAFKRNILIVDDESAILDFLRDGLSSYQDRFNVYTASSGDEALRIMDGHRITLLITDIRMPIMDGFELIRDAKAKNPDTRFIVMTAYGSDEIFEKSMEYGAIDYLKKPFEFDRFAKKMFRALEPAKGFRASSFHGFHLTDALQLVHMVRKSQTIRVKTEFGDECWIHLRDGEVVHAELEDLQGEEAFYRIIGLDGGEIDSLPLSNDIPTTISRSLAALILEGMRLKDERDAVKKGERKERKIVPEASTSGEKIIPASDDIPLGSQTPGATPEQDHGDELRTADVVISWEQTSSGKENPAENESEEPSSLADKDFYRFVDEGFDCYKTGDFQEARECWEKALELRPDDRNVQFNLNKLAEKEAN
jgi:CheY-like chemotaxis protein